MDPEPLSDLTQFVERFKLLRYKKGDLLFRAGTSPSGIFFLKKGFVRGYSISKEGEELTIIVVQPNDFFPLRCLFTDQETTHNYEALTPIEVYLVPREELKKFFHTFPHVLYQTTGHIVIRMTGLMDRMEHLVFGSAYARIASVFVLMAQRFGISEKIGITIPIPLTHKDIASMVGVTRETVSLEIKKLERKNLLGKKGTLLLVKDIEKLKKESAVDVKE